MDEHWLTTGDDIVELWRADNGEWRWSVVAPNGEIVGTSGEGYVRRIDAQHAAERHHPRVGTPDD